MTEPMKPDHCAHLVDYAEHFYQHGQPSLRDFWSAYSSAYWHASMGWNRPHDLLNAVKTIWPSMFCPQWGTHLMRSR